MTRAPRHFDLVSHWTLSAPLEAVWAALVRTEDWPAWWPQVQTVRVLQPGRADGVGRVVRVRWHTRLPYSLELDVQAVEVVRLQRLRGRASGPLKGEGIWLLTREGPLTLVTYVWRVQLATRWMQLLAPVLAPLFRWNHSQVMGAGGAGLARYLAGPGRAPERATAGS